MPIAYIYVLEIRSIYLCMGVMHSGSCNSWTYRVVKNNKYGMMNVQQIMYKHHISLCLEGNTASIAIRWPSRFLLLIRKLQLILPILKVVKQTAGLEGPFELCMPFARKELCMPFARKKYSTKPFQNLPRLPVDS